MKKLILLFVITTLTLTLSAQSYSPCYTEFMAKGNAAYNQGKYNEAKTYYAKAKQCAGGNPTEAQRKINSCDAKLKAQQEAAEAKRKAAARQRAIDEAKSRGYKYITVNGVTFKMVYVQGGYIPRLFDAYKRGFELWYKEAEKAPERKDYYFKLKDDLPRVQVVCGTPLTLLRR